MFFCVSRAPHYSLLLYHRENSTTYSSSLLSELSPLDMGKSSCNFFCVDVKSVGMVLSNREVVPMGMADFVVNWTILWGEVFIYPEGYVTDPYQCRTQYGTTFTFRVP